MPSKITRIVIHNLFGFLHHNIELNEENITFIHGPNGCGKTTLLRLISAFLEWEIKVIDEVNFDYLEIYYSTEERILVRTSNFENGDASLMITLFKGDQEIDKYDIFKKNKEDLVLDKIDIDSYIPSLRRIGADTWIDRRGVVPFLYEEILEKYSDELIIETHDRPQWLRDIQDSVKLNFVQTQRLIKTNFPSEFPRRKKIVKNNINIAESYSDELKNIIEETFLKSAEISQKKESTFPDRLLSLREDNSVSEPKIRESYKETEEKISALMESGLIDQEKNISLPDSELEETEKKVLALYLKDINEKLSVYNPLFKKVDIFLKILNPKFRNKRLKVSQKEGFLIETTQGKRQKLKPSQLSSGEQHQIVLFYELIFKTDNNSFFLIDEPEISLHVDWQRQFFSDISKISKLGDHSFLIATHSPQIIGSRRDLAVSLDGGILNE